MSSTKDPSSLTRFSSGSIGELWSLSLPLMIASFASLLMIFTDRLFLAHYSIDALNASVNAGTLAWAFMSGFGMVTAMSEVFVAQYNGAGQREHIGRSVWQMIWFSLFSCLFFVPMSIWGAPLIFSGDRYAELEIEYFQWLSLFSPSYVLMTALMGFFIGRGKTQIMIGLALLANLFNVFLDWILIFGVEGWIAPMGIRGAAVATCFGYFFESIVLAILFLKKKNHLLFGSWNWKIHWEEMKKSLRVGVPQGVFSTLEFSGWAIFYWMMSSISVAHITISSVCQSFVILLSFFSDGLSRGAAAVAGNLIGARRPRDVYKVLRSGIVLMSIFYLLSSLLLVFSSPETIHLFFDPSKKALGPEMIDALQMCMLFAFIYILFDGFRWVLGGLLAAAGDTFFLLIFGSLSVWIFLLAPLYLFVVQNSLAVEYAWGITVCYSVLFFLVYLYRFLKGNWETIQLVDSPQVVSSPQDQTQGRSI